MNTKNGFLSLSLNARGSERIALLEMDGDVGAELTSRWFRGELDKVGKFDRFVARINSPGGSVTEGFAIINMMEEIRVPKRAETTGFCASMGSIIACACDTVAMHPADWVVAHNPWACAIGDEHEFRKMADILGKMKDSALGLYLRHTSMPREELVAALDAETWIRGEDAKSMGWNFELIENSKDSKDNNKEKAMLFDFSGMNFKRIPDAFKAMIGINKNNQETDNKEIEQMDFKAELEKEKADRAAEAKAFADQLAETKANAQKEFDVVNAKVGELSESLKKSGEALAAMTVEFEAAKKANGELSQAKAEAEKAQAEAEAAKTKAEASLARLSPGLSAPESTDSEPGDFKAALAKCGGDYVKARKLYPGVYGRMNKSGK